MKALHKICAALLLTAGFTAGLAAKVTPAFLFQDHMVIQRDKPFPVWGTADPGEQVEVSFGGQTLKTAAGADGKWEAVLAPLAVNAEGQTMRLKGSANEVVLSDILVGDLWLCTGQSNMEMSFSWGLLEGGKYAEEADKFPMIRQIKFAKVMRVNPQEAPVIQINWTPASKKTIAPFTAAGYFFARRIVSETSVPVGLLNASWSGSRIEPFIPYAGWNQPEQKELSSIYGQLAAFQPGTPAWTELSRKEIDAVKKWLAAAEKALADGKQLPPAENFIAQAPANAAMAYNSMIEPYKRIPIKGVLWYQGCSNDRDGEAYFHKMKALIDGFRDSFRDPELPFYFVQLAAFHGATDDPAGGNGFARIREAQRRTMTIPHTGMACTIDIGMQKDIHPKNKLDVGERLALWALRNEYGKKDLVVSGPLFRSMKVEDGKIRLEFDYADGLMTAVKTGLAAPVPAPSAKPAHFAIAGADGKWFWADAVIDGKTIVVSSPSVKEPAAVRYAYRAYPDGVNVYNAAGLPMVPFYADKSK